MKQHLLFLAIAASLSTASMAQAESPQNAYDVIPPMTAFTPAIPAATGQLWWANYDLDENIRYVIGTDIAEHYDAAVFIPNGLLTEGSVTVDGFSFYPLTDSVKNVKVWVCPFLPASPNDWQESVDVVEIEKDKFNDVAFNNHHIIPKNGLYIGVSFDVTSLKDEKAKNPLSYTMSDYTRENSFFYKTASKLKWTAIDGNAFVRVLFGGGNFKKNAVSVKDFSTAYVVKGESVSVPLSLRNMGTADVESISYTITTGDATSDEVTKAVTIKGFQESATTYIDVPADTETKVHQKTLTITKVNGQVNESVDCRAKGQVITMAESYKATPVVEMFVGNGYKYSPTAIVGMEKTREKYGDQVVIISVHHDDVMSIDDYMPLLYNARTIPSSFLNREFDVYPSPFFLLKEVATAQTRSVPASISLQAEWNADQASSTDIKLSSTSVFCYDDEKANYGVAYVVLADGLEGTGADWEQKNGFSGQSVSEDMKFWGEASESVAGLTFDNVAIAAKEIFSGVSISDSKGVKAGEQLSNTNTISIAGNKLVQDKNRLSAVALLIDRSNNQIVNAAKTAIATVEQGIENLNADGVATACEYYDMTGRRVSPSYRGVCIVRKTDGKSIKVIK